MAQTIHMPLRAGCLPVEASVIAARPRLVPQIKATGGRALDARLVASGVTLCAACVFVVLGIQVVPWAVGIAPGPMLASPVTPFILSIALVLLAWRRASDLGKAARAQSEADRRVHELAYLDEVTGLYNRRYLVDRIDSEAGRALSLILLDLDDFKKLNGRHGQAAGDDLLRKVAERLVSVADGAICARLGGDEFAVLLAGVYATEEYALFLASDILAELNRSVVPAETVGSISASIGVSQGAPSESAASLMRKAELAMDEAKRLGRNRVIAFHPEIEPN
jgi:diguanylate cyclase (GGDEF)-like protein